MRLLPYLYALFLAGFVNPFQSWLGTLDGLFFSSWDRLFNDLAGGVLFGYGALIATEIFVRVELYPSVHLFSLLLAC
jgi:hypothetical protein